MPYGIFKRDDKHCVYKVNLQTRQPIGKSLGCHSSKIKARNQIIAIEISENKIKMTDIDELDEFLQHFGVPGMRWGVRRGKGARNRVALRKGAIARLKGKKGSIKPSEEAVNISKLRKKKATELTNKELEEVAKRVNLEKQFKSLNPTKQDRAKKLVGEILGNAAKQAVTEVAKNTMSKQLQSIVDAKLKSGG